ncbi:protein of unknown function [Pseudomonas mediterranea]
MQARQMGQQRRLLHHRQPEGMRQLFAHLLRVQRRAPQRQPVQPTSSRSLEETLGEQRALATARRRAEQLYSCFGREQGLAQGPARHMRRGQARQQSRTVRARGHGGHVRESLLLLSHHPSPVSPTFGEVFSALIAPHKKTTGEIPLWRGNLSVVRGFIHGEGFICGEGIYPRWAAQQPHHRRLSQPETPSRRVWGRCAPQRG